MFEIRRHILEGEERLAISHHVAAPEFDRVEIETSGKLLDCGFDGEAGLADAVAAECAGRNGVGNHRYAVDALIEAAIIADRLPAAVEEDAGTMIAIGAGVRKDVHADRGEDAVARRAEFHLD